MPLNIALHIDQGLTPSVVRLISSRANRLLELLSMADKNVSIVLMDDGEMATFNEKYRNRQGPTNVLSFPADTPPETFPSGFLANELGDILISVETAGREAIRMNRTLDVRLTELIIHGMLHLLGYDHEQSAEEEGRMRDKEQELYRQLQRFGRKSMVKLAVNVDHVATVRQARGTIEPDPVLAAAICELAGASGIVVHLREDRRHIQDRDVRLLRQTVKTRLNLEMAAAREMIEIALDVRPDMVTLVPEKRQELTTEGGLNVHGNRKKIGKAIEQLRQGNIPVSLFIDPDYKQIKAAKQTGATYVELHTGRYCDATTEEEREYEFDLIEKSAAAASEAGLKVNAGHGLDYRNTARVAALETIEELSIGHAIVSRAVLVGLDQAVREMMALIRHPFPGH